MFLGLSGACECTGCFSGVTYDKSWWLTMCGLDGRVETFLEPRRKIVGLMQREDRANVVDSIVKCGEQGNLENYPLLFLRNFLKHNDDAHFASLSFFLAGDHPIPHRTISSAHTHRHRRSSSPDY